MTDRTRREALAALASLAGLAGCTGGPAGRTSDESPSDDPTTSPTPSPTPDGDPATPERVDTGEDATRWAVQFDGPVTDTPAVADGTVVAGTGLTDIGTPEPGSSGSWSLAALGAADGAVQWTHGLPAPTFGSPVVAAGGVYVQTGFSTGMTGAKQRLVKVAGGERRWTTEPSSGFHHLLAVDGDGRAFVGTSDDAIDTSGERLFAVDGDDGSRVWSVESGDAFGGRLVEHGLLVNLGGVALEVRDPADGSQRWRTETGLLVEPSSRIRIVDGAVPVSEQDGDEEAFGLLDLADGSVRWTFSEDLGGPFVPTGATTLPEATAGGQQDGLLVGTEYDGFVYGLAPGDGSVRWRFEADGETRDGPVGDGDRVYVGDMDGTVYALDATTGDELWRTEIGGYVGWLGVAGDTVVAERGKGTERLVGLARDDGSTRWSFEADENLTRPALGDGVVTVGSASGLVRVLGE